jgi:transposase-like protein
MDFSNRKNSREFKEEAVRMLESNGKSGHELEKDLGSGSSQI